MFSFYSSELRGFHTLRARDIKGLVLFGLFGQKNRSEAEPGMARPGALKKKIRHALYLFDFPDSSELNLIKYRLKTCLLAQLS
jgi:hypothetical protein